MKVSWQTNAGKNLKDKRASSAPQAAPERHVKLVEQSSVTFKTTLALPPGQPRSPSPDVFDRLGPKVLNVHDRLGPKASSIHDRLGQKAKSVKSYTPPRSRDHSKAGSITSRGRSREPRPTQPMADKVAECRAEARKRQLSQNSRSYYNNSPPIWPNYLTSP